MLDAGGAAGDVRGGEEVVERHVDELGVAEMVFAVGQRQFQAFGDGVQVVRRVVRHAVDAGFFDEEERLDQGGALAPGAAGDDLVAAPHAAHGGFDAGAEVGEVGHGEVAALGLLEGDDLAGDVALIEGVVRGLQPGFAATGGAGLVGHVLQGVGEVGLLEVVADLGDLVAGEEDGGVLRPAAVGGLLAGDRELEEGVHREALAGEADGVGGDLGEAHGPVALQRGDPGVGGGGDDGAQDADGDLAAVFGHEQVGREGAGPVA